MQKSLEDLTPMLDVAQAEDSGAEEESAAGLPNRWRDHVPGVSLAAQSNCGQGRERRAFQVKLPFAPHKLYFSFKTWTEEESVPCASENCWNKLPGVRLQSCGRDVCVFSAARACRNELDLAYPDRRKRRLVNEAALETWRKRWRITPLTRLRSKTRLRY